MNPKLITLTTDFGLRDGYVAAMKGAILTRDPQLRLVDVTHEIPPGDVTGAAYVLAQAAAFFPEGTVHLVVVDPGVGGERRRLACAAGGHFFVAPDNGVLSVVLEREDPIRVHAISRPELWREERSAVFDGRDIFGPVAAYLAGGGSLAEVGARVEREGLSRASWPEPERGEDGWCGEVIYVDHFGNLVTNLPLSADREPGGSLAVAGESVPIVRAYSDVEPGSLLALRGSTGLIEIARNRGSAAELLGAGRGLMVTFRAKPGS